MLAARLALAVVAAVAPGLFAWWEGRRLTRQVDSPLFPERWLHSRRRLGQVAAVALTVVLLAGGWQALWLAPLLVTVLLAGSFPARRTLFAERWSLIAYASWVVRLFTAFGLFRVVLVVTPLLVYAAGPRRVWVPALLAVVMVAQLVRPRRDTLRLLRAEPLDPDRVPGLAAFADRLQEASTAPRPQLLELDLRGGRWTNALALPHPREPAVLFSSPLLELLRPVEVAAVLAHEVAHLEHHNPRFLRRAVTLAWLLLAGALAWAPLTWLLVPDGTLVVLAWPLAVLLLAFRVLARSREQEAVSDRRALELGADPEALVAALTALHLASRLPRRLAAEVEARTTHPSLARRVQAIRAWAATPGAAVAPAEDTLPLAVPGALAGEWVVVDRERVSWLEGVPADTPPDPQALAALATSLRCVAYSRLGELRVEAGSGGAPRLVAVESKGPRSVWQLAEGGVAALQAALDLVDSRLAPPPRQSAWGQLLRAELGMRGAALLGLVAATLLPQAGGTIAVPSLLALIAPRASALVAAGVSALAGAGLVLVRLGAGTLAGYFPVLGTVLAVGLGLGLLGLGFLRLRRGDPHRERTLWPALILVGGAGAVWAGVVVLSWLAGGGGLDLYHLHRLIRGVPSASGLPLAAAVALLAARRRWSLVGAVILCLLAAVTLWVGSVSFRSAFVRDPLVGRATPTRPIPLEPGLLWRQEMTGWPDSLRVAPAGRAFAVASVDEAGFEEEAQARVFDWEVWRGGGEQGGPLVEVRAVDVAFAGADRLLVLTQAGDGLELTQLDLATGAEAGWAVPLPRVYGPRLESAAEGTGWAVCGREGNPAVGLRYARWAGRVGTAEVTVSPLRLLPEEEEEGWVEWVPLGTDSDLALSTRYRGAPFGSRFSLGSLFAKPLVSLTVADRQGTAPVASSRLTVACHEIPGRAGALCVAADGESSWLWRLAPQPEGGARLEPLGALRADWANVVSLTSTAALLQVWEPAPSLLQVSGPAQVVLELDSGRLTRVRLPEQVGWGTCALAEPDLLVAIHRRGPGSAVAVYRLAGS